MRGDHHPQIAAHLLVESGDGKIAPIQAVPERAGEIIPLVRTLTGARRRRRLLRPPSRTGLGAHLKIETVEDGFAGIVRPAPIGHDEALKPPLPLEDVVEKVVVFAAELAAELVVCAHDRPGAALLDGRPKRRQVDLPQRALVHLDIDGAPLRLLIVSREMLHAGGDAMRLHCADVAHDHSRSEERILSQEFGSSAVERRALDVHAGPEHDVLAPLAGLLPDHIAIDARRLGIPGRGNADQHRHAGGKIVGVPGDLPGVRPDVFAHAIRTVGHPAARNAQARDRGGRELGVGMHKRQLLFQCHTAEEVLHPRFERRGRVEIGWPRFLGPERPRTKKSAEAQSQGRNAGKTACAHLKETVVLSPL